MDTKGKKFYHSCPICNYKSKLLRGNAKRRYFCQECCIEFEVDDNDEITAVFNIDPNGDLIRYLDWENKK